MTVIDGIDPSRVHERADWLEYASEPFTGPAYPEGRITHLIGHWPGGRVPTFVDLEDVLRYIARTHDFYMTRPGDNYALGYSFAVISQEGFIHDGDVVVIRGYDFRNAANVGGKVDGNANGWSASANMLVDIDEAGGATPAALETFRAIGADISRREARTPIVQPHHAIEYTRCFGEGLTAQYAAGLMTPTRPDPDPKDPEMITPHLWKHADHDAIFYVDSTGTVCHVDGPLFDELTAAGVKLRISRNEHVYASRAALHGGPRPEWTT